VDSVDAVSWYDLDAAGHVRLEWHNRYDRYIYDEVVSFIRHRTDDSYLASVGLSFGAFHALNFAFRHPDVTGKVVSLNGVFDMTGFFPDFYSESLYYNNPLHFMPNLTDERILGQISAQKIFLASSPEDPHLGDYYRMAEILTRKGIPHTFEVPHDAWHDWPFWKRYLPRCL
jgi:esterase/lipase superfamily enzyme